MFSGNSRGKKEGKKEEAEGLLYPRIAERLCCILGTAYVLSRKKAAGAT